MAALALILLLPFASGLVAKNTHESITSDSNPTFLSTDADWKLPKAVSPEIDAALRKLVNKVHSEDKDTMYFGAYVDEEGHSLHVKTSQTTSAGHKEHMAHTKMNNMELMGLGAEMVGNTWQKRLLGEQPIAMSGPAALIDDVREIMAPLGTQYFAHHSGKTHKFSKIINNHENRELGLVILDPQVKLKSGLTREVQQIVEKFIDRSRMVSMDNQAVFDVVFQPETNTLAFREMYADAAAAIASKEATQDVWKRLTEHLGNPVVKFDVHGPSSEVKKLKESSKFLRKGEANKMLKFYSLHSGFQKVSLQ